MLQGWDGGKFSFSSLDSLLELLPLSGLGNGPLAGLATTRQQATCRGSFGRFNEEIRGRVSSISRIDTTDFEA